MGRPVVVDRSRNRVQAIASMTSIASTPPRRLDSAGVAIGATGRG